MCANKVEDVNLSSFNIITKINESKTLAKNVPYKYKFDGKKCNSNQNKNNDKYRCECKIPKEYHVC